MSKIIQYLNEAHATEVALVRVLQSQIAMTPRGSYRAALDRHLRETRGHAERIEARLGELGAGDSALQLVNGVAQAVVGQALALAKTPLDLVRGHGGEEKVLKNAKDACATEALEIATYTALERLARAQGDDATAQLAASIRADEEKMLERVLSEIPKLTEAVLGDSYDVTRTGAADTARRTQRKAKRAVGAEAPIAGYDRLTADEIVARVPRLSEADRAEVRAYERAHKDRVSVIRATEREPATA